MKNSIALKFIAFVLCSLSLVSILFSGTGIVFMEAYDLYNTPLEAIQQQQLNYASSTLADYYANHHAALSLSNAPTDLLNEIYDSYYVNHLGSQYAVRIYENGRLSESINDTEKLKGQLYQFTYTVTSTYPIVTGEVYRDLSGGTVVPTTPEDAATEHPEPGVTTPTTAAVTAAPASIEPTVQDAYADALTRVAGQEVLYSDEYHHYIFDEQGSRNALIYSINYYQGPTYDVTVYLSSNTIMDADFMLLTVLYPYRDYYIPMVLGALVLFIITIVYLCAAAGRNRKGEIHLAAINRIPLDLYFICCGGFVGLLCIPVFLLFESALYESSYNIWDNPKLCLLICGLCGFGISSTVIGFLYAFAAQIKASNNYWLRHTIIGWCFGLVRKTLRWVGNGISHCFRGCRAVFQMLPIIWQWLLTAAEMVVIPFLLLILCVSSYSDFATFFWGMQFFFSLVLDVAIICYGAWCIGTLLKGARHMAQGNLSYQIDTRYLVGIFKNFALQLNALAGAAQVAAERQMKSERMKTELITNVSHDIKTPLTSIINYVDLMKKPHSDEESITYLDVLDRQSQRLKKLIDDLMEMSKASSGNVTVEIGQVDAVEAVNQALGEFSDKLDRVNLTPIFRHPDSPVIMRADGRLVWRVLSNVLSNAVKYALPDTRLYIDLMVLQGNAVLAIKNISREQLNVNADELMERFVRGDASRNTEGSGLGLNIAKNLVELQKGQMHLMVDGDLFKVTLIFPLG